MKFLGQVILGTIFILPVMIIGSACRRLADAADRGSDWLELKVFGEDYE